MKGSEAPHPRKLPQAAPTLPRKERRAWRGSDPGLSGGPSGAGTPGASLASALFCAEATPRPLLGSLQTRPKALGRRPARV